MPPFHRHAEISTDSTKKKVVTAKSGMMDRISFYLRDVLARNALTNSIDLHSFAIDR